MLTSALQRHPSLRLLLPLAAGIVIGYYLPFPHKAWGMSIVISGWLFVTCAYLTRKRWRWFFGVAVNLCFLALGYILASWQMGKTDFNFPNQTSSFLAVIKEAPQEKPRTFMLEAEVYSPSETPHRFLLYVAKDSISSTIRRGDTLMVNARLQPPNNDAMTDGFDYVRYLKRKGITGTAYVAGNHWIITGHSDYVSWMQQLQDFRYNVLSLYQRLGFQGDALAVLSALTTGVREDLSEELRESYSVAGVSHVLALSGLHIGLIYGLLIMVFMPMWRKVWWMRPLSCMLTIAILWLFALFTGLSSSVVRASFMFSIYTLATFREERPASLHVLSLTAFCMLLVRPLWLFDVGFQLSFVAVASIIILQPRINNMFPNLKSRLYNRVKGLLTVSLAAQIGTAPIVILYFHRFSTHFLLSNLLVLPLVTMVMYTAVLMLACTPLPALQQMIAVFLQWLLGIQNNLLTWLTRLPGASIDGLKTNTLEILFFYISVYWFIMYLAKHTADRAIITLCTVWILVSCHLANVIIMK